MRRAVTCTATLGLLLGAGVTPVAAAPAQGPPVGQPRLLAEKVYVESTVDSDGDGRRDRIYISISRPAGGGAKIPSILVMTPYNEAFNPYPYHNQDVDRLPQEGGTLRAAPGGAGPESSFSAMRAAAESARLDGSFAARGYAEIEGMSLGTGKSDGCPSSGGDDETQAAVAVVDWLNGRAKGFDAGGKEVTADWSSGNVGMTGASYDGSLANAVAAAGTPGLKAIVPIAGISNWYDYYRANGLVTGAGSAGGDLDTLAQKVAKRPKECAAQMARILAGEDRATGDYTPFWQERDYTRRAANVRAAVYLVHGHNDWNVRGAQYSGWWEALGRAGVPRKIWIHNGAHTIPTDLEYRLSVEKWFDHFVKGVDTDVLKLPVATVQDPAGTFRTAAGWPDPAAKQVTHQLGAMSPTAPGELSRGPVAPGAPQTFVDNGRKLTITNLVAGPDAANPNRLIYRTPALARASRLVGAPTVTLKMAVLNRTAANVTALLVDYSGGTPRIVTRGWMDPQNHGDLAVGEKLVPGQDYTLRFALQPKEWIFPAGSRIGLVVVSTDNANSLRPPAGTELRLTPEGSTVTIPLVG